MSKLSNHIIALAYCIDALRYHIQYRDDSTAKNKIQYAQEMLLSEKHNFKNIVIPLNKIEEIYLIIREGIQLKTSDEDRICYFMKIRNILQGCIGE